MAQQRTAEQERERKRKASEAIAKKTKELNAFHAKKKAEAVPRKPGHMTESERKRWHNMSKQEQRDIEKRLELEQEKKPYLVNKLASERETIAEKIANGTATEEEKKHHETNTPKMSQFQRFNPNFQYDSKGNPIFPEKSLFEGVPGYHINMPTLTEEQQALADYLTSTVQKQLPDLMNQMRQPVSMDIFSHMTNPILQKMANPQVLFPSQMQNQTYSGLEGLLGQLGQQGMEYAINKAPDAWKYAQQNAPNLYEGAKGFGNQALQYGQQAGGNIMDLLSGLANRFRPQQ